MSTFNPISTTSETNRDRTNRMIKPAAAVFCGSSQGNHPQFMQQAFRLGKLLGQQGIPIIYGGGNTGLMGAVADGCLAAQGQITGVIPELLVGIERAHAGVKKMHIVKDMHVRKQKMYQLSEAFIILPGGNGTLDELFEVITWNCLGIHQKKILLLNTGHFYDHLLAHYRQMQEAGFLHHPAAACFQEYQQPEEILAALTQH